MKSRRRANGFQRCAYLLTVVMSLLVALPGTSPAASSRSQYVEEVEPICKRATLANGDVLNGVEAMILRDELKRAAKRFRRAADALEGTVRQLATVPRPPADVSRLERWLSYSRSGEARLREMARALDHGRKAVVQSKANQLLKGVKRANATVVGFEFDYCRVNPARLV